MNVVTKRNRVFLQQCYFDLNEQFCKSSEAQKSVCIGKTLSVERMNIVTLINDIIKDVELFVCSRISCKLDRRRIKYLQYMRYI